MRQPDGGGGLAPVLKALVSRKVSLDHCIIIAVTLAVLARILWVASAPTVAIAFRSTDDAYYYLNVARNAVRGNGLTFDGINTTNGFHPLWMLCLLLIYGIFDPGSSASFQAVFSLVALIAGLNCWFAYRAALCVADRPAAATSIALLLVAPFASAFLNGLETGLLVLFLLVLFEAMVRCDLASTRTRFREDMLLGLLLSLVFLSRLDSMFHIASVLGFVVWRAVRDHGVGVGLVSALLKFVRASIPPILLVLPYLLWNTVAYGHAVPISGRLKSSFPAINFDPSRIGNLHTLFGTVQILFAAAGFLALLLMRSSGDHPTAGRGRKLVVVFWVGCVLHFLHGLFFMPWAAHWWHYASYVPVTLLVSAMLLDDITARVGRRTALIGGVAATTALLVAVTWYVDARIRGLHHGPWYAASLWIRDHLPANAVVGMTDAGLVGYFCERPTVNLDGVINSYAYQLALRDHKLADFLRNCGVTHIADYEVRYREGREVIRLPARLYKAPGGAIVATPQAEVYRSEPYPRRFPKTGEVRFIVWDINKVQIVDDARHLFLGPP